MWDAPGRLIGERAGGGPKDTPDSTETAKNPNKSGSTTDKRNYAGKINHGRVTLHKWPRGRTPLLSQPP